MVLQDNDPANAIEVTHRNADRMSHTRLFIRRYENGNLADDVLVDGAYDWFESLNFE